MNTIWKSRLPAVLCVLVLPLSAIAVFPVAEIGMNDDWSYIKSCQVLAQTGHIVYNGWATATIGWQLYLGAIFVKLFGPSFTAIRSSTVLVGMVTAFLLQRTFVRTGISSRNSTIGTLGLLLSPLFLPLAFSFMTDIGGLFCVVVCVYACLRAIGARSERAALAWLIFAALSNALGGTVRQIAWLGVLVMVPSTVWLLRRSTRIVVAGAFLYIISIVFIVCALRWFQRQPYSIPEPLLPEHIESRSAIHLGVQFVSLLLSLALLLSPIMSAFIAVTWRRRGYAGVVFVSGGVFCGLAGLFLLLYHPHAFLLFVAPFKGNYLTQHGLVAETLLLHSMGPIVLSFGLRIFLTLATLTVLLSFLAFLRDNWRIDEMGQAPGPISGKILLILLVPFVVAYLCLLLPRGYHGDLMDRYLLPLMPIGFILLLRFFQDRVQPNLPVVSVALVAIFAAYAIAGTHDGFAKYRARETAIGELRAAGIPDTSIDGGFEYNGTTQIEHFGYIAEPRMRIPLTPPPAPVLSVSNKCEPLWPWLTPGVVPVFSLSYEPPACGGVSRFAPASYRDWLRAETVEVYIVNTVKPAPAAR